MGGSDDPSNLVEVTIEEHAELHLSLYLEHGKYEDYIAYNMLAGKTTEGERVLNLVRSDYMKNRVVSQRIRDRMREYNLTKVYTDEERKARSERTKGDKNPFYGKTHTNDTKERIREAARQQWQKTKYVWVNNGSVTKRVPSDQIPEGFVRGRQLNNSK